MGELGLSNLVSGQGQLTNSNTATSGLSGATNTGVSFGDHFIGKKGTTSTQIVMGLAVLGVVVVLVKALK